MKLLTKLFYAFIIVFIIGYLLFSFILLSFNPYDWGFGGRQVYSLLCVATFGALSVIIGFDHK